MKGGALLFNTLMRAIPTKEKERKGKGKRKEEGRVINPTGATDDRPKKKDANKIKSMPFPLLDTQRLLEAAHQTLVSLERGTPFLSCPQGYESRRC